MGKIAYLAHGLRHLANPARRSCPNCGGERSILIERKAAITALRRCADCLLMYRTPTDDPVEAEAFYNSDYAQMDTTDLPSPDALEAMKGGDWRGLTNYREFVSHALALGAKPGAKLFDFGCSWGYGSYQLRQAGFDVLSYEISRRRAAYGEQNLGLRTVPDFETWAEASPASVDVFFSAFVLEHVPSPSRIIERARRVLKPGGLFVAFLPNGSASARSFFPEWSQQWGEVHPNLPDDVFLNAAVPDRPRLFAATPANISAETRIWLGESDQPAAIYVNDLRSGYLLFAFRN